LEPTRKALDDPLTFIQESVRRRRILWTYHVNLRLHGRYIARSDILDAVNSYEVIVAYPEDKYLPSYLVLAKHAGFAFHVLFATNVEVDNVRVVTADRPDPAEWELDLRTRRAVI